VPRKRDPNRDKALVIWKEQNGEITNRALAEQLDVPEKTIGGWKSKDKWTQKLNGVLQTNERSTPNRREPKESRAPSRESRKRGGNPNPSNQFSHRNNPKLIHGLRSKFLHQEQVEIMEAMDGLSIADQIWLQIEIKFSAIIRMQKIMWVNDADDHLKEDSGSSWGDDAGSETLKVAFAFERYESYIKAQTRAMAEYRNLAKQFLIMSHADDERRLKLEQMQLNIEKTKAETDFAQMRAAKLRGDRKDTSMLDALVEGRQRYEQMMKDRENDG
jgi:uncharacterized protein YjcR